MLLLIVVIMSVSILCLLSMSALKHTSTANQHHNNLYSQKTEKLETKTIREYHIGKTNENPVVKSEKIQTSKPIIQKHETINYDFSGFISFATVVAVIFAFIVVIRQIDKRIDFENLRNIRATKKLIKRSDKFIKNGNKKDLFIISDTVERQINYNNALKTKKGDNHSVLLSVLNNELNDKQKIMIPILQN